MRNSRVGDVRKRFFERYDVSPSGCWVWNGCRIKMGGYYYGSIAGQIDGVRYTKPGVAMGAHRASWILHYGPIPPGAGPHGTVVMHKCDNPLCVNPEHLMLGTQRDNIDDMNAKKRGDISGLASKRGSSHRNSALTAEQVQYVLSSSKNAVELGAELGVTRHLISNVRCGKTYTEETNSQELRELAKLRKGLSRPGAGNPNSKLTSEQVRYIRSSPKTTYAIAEELGVTQPTVASARRRATYKDID